MKSIFEHLNKIDDDASLGLGEITNSTFLKEGINKGVIRLIEEDEENSTENTVDNRRDSSSGNSSVNAIINKLRSIDNYSTFVDALKKLNGKQIELFKKEFGNVEAIKPNTSKTGIAVTKLLPTQSEIDWKKSLSYGLKQDCSYFFKSPVELGMPVLTYNGKYIIDGHHRWSQVFMFNPKGQVSCIDFKYQQGSATDVLKDFQAAVLATTGKVAVGTAGTNIWSVSKGELEKFIEENITEACYNSLIKVGVAEDRESAIAYIVNNAMILQTKIRPASGAPDRVDMPQTDPNVIKKAAAGLSDMSESLNEAIQTLARAGYKVDVCNKTITK